MATGLLALLDDVAAIAKVAAASLDDVAGQAARAGVKSAGVVIDDAAVTPRYLVGFAPDRELPIVRKITVGSLKNKLLFLLPAALVLSLVAPWLITPLLMLGGAYLCYEGTEKAFEAFFPHDAHAHEAKAGIAPADATALENQKVQSAIRTDFILSAEIMALALSTIPDLNLLSQAMVLALVGVGITFLVYGSVALIVKADDIGLALSRHGRLASTRAFGRGLVGAMPGFLGALAVIGTAAMIWVGGSIIVHGLAHFGFAGIEHVIHDFSHAVAGASPVLSGLVGWLVSAFGFGVVGLAVGALLIPLVGRIVAPAAEQVVRMIKSRG